MESFREIEKEMQKFWEERGIFKTRQNPQNKYFILDMFPYPSGDLHIGHSRNYTIGDTVTRFKKIRGFDVLHTFGWDAFGLPAENAAIIHKIHPEEWTRQNIEISKKHLIELGIAFDWDAETATCDPEFYRWNQYFFIKFYERKNERDERLVYRKQSWVNWCPNCQTVLANEQVKDGRCWRSTCNAVIGKRLMYQWYFRITDYAKKLLDGLKQLKNWPEPVKIMQENWIGRSQGVEVNFTLEDGTTVPIFTTRPDTLYGVTFLALAPDAPLVLKLLAQSVYLTKYTREEQDRYKREIESYVAKTLMKSEIERAGTETEKTGVFTGLYAINPLNNERIPVYVADFVLASYGTGMIMAVPGHDQRDFEFAKKYNILIKVVINPSGVTLDPKTMDKAYIDEGVMTNSGQFDGLNNIEGIEKVTDYLEAKELGKRTVNYRLKDWLISRQRYWGTPIPMIHCEKCGIVPVPEKDLPVLLPKNVKDYQPKGKSVLEGVPEFINTTCPKCEGKARRDPDTMDTFVDSSWYFLRYTDPKNDKIPFDPNRTNQWMPIDEYVGGIEHATGHLIYFRFFTKVLHDMGMLKCDEPCHILHTHGMVKMDGITMSSSKRHGVWLGDFLKEHGADVCKLAVLFAAPPEKEIDWTNDLVVGVSRFLSRIKALYENNTPIFNLPSNNQQLTTNNPEEQRLYIRLNQTIKKVIDDSEKIQYNTAIAALMEFLNDLTGFENKQSEIYQYSLGVMIKLLAPFAPHISEYLWLKFSGKKHSVFEETLPEPDKSALTFTTITIPIQIQGKLRSKIEVAQGTSEDEIKRLAQEDDKVKKYTEGKTIKQIIYVPNRLINIVI
ncbi:MAG: leucine--tRNA ligase [Candidatus Latescibacteria bacterium]|nr:leucine--tRNA ligase [Candidatus Latescibacterota bacterium]